MRALSVVLSIMLMTAGARAQESAGNREKAFLEIEATRRAAIAAKDFATLTTIYAVDFRGIIGNGEIADRAFLFEVFRHDDPTVKFTTDELVVRQFGDAAIVTGRLTSTRDNAIVSQQRFSHFYALRKGHWVIVAAEGTPVRNPMMPGDTSAPRSGT